MSMYFGKEKQRASPSMTATYATVTRLTARLENVRHKLNTDNLFSSPVLYDDLRTMAINCCRTATPNRKGMLKPGDMKTKVRGNLTATQCGRTKKMYTYWQTCILHNYMIISVMSMEKL